MDKQEEQPSSPPSRTPSQQERLRQSGKEPVIRGKRARDLVDSQVQEEEKEDLEVDLEDVESIHSDDEADIAEHVRRLAAAVGGKPAPEIVKKRKTATHWVYLGYVFPESASPLVNEARHMCTRHAKLEQSYLENFKRLKNKTGELTRADERMLLTASHQQALLLLQEAYIAALSSIEVNSAYSCDAILKGDMTRAELQAIEYLDRHGLKIMRGESSETRVLTGRSQILTDDFTDIRIPGVEVVRGLETVDEEGRKRIRTQLHMDMSVSELLQQIEEGNYVLEGDEDSEEEAESGTPETSE